jgi:hypothetical protein
MLTGYPLARIRFCQVWPPPQMTTVFQLSANFVTIGPIGCFAVFTEA